MKQGDVVVHVRGVFCLHSWIICAHEDSLIVATPKKPIQGHGEDRAAFVETLDFSALTYGDNGLEQPVIYCHILRIVSRTFG